ncbi:MAG: response regulator transcription factor [Bacteroidia bacterium]|nr:response regulator transcription factor [Bacteroidia bacterium]
MKKFTYLIVDDEPLARNLIASHAARMEGLELAGVCASALDAANLLRRTHVDLVFLDIQMPQLTGLQLVQTLKHPPAIILTTAFRDYAPEAFDLDVVDYLLKPISFDRLLRAVNKFFDLKTATHRQRSDAREETGYVYIKADRKVHKVLVDDIRFIESLDDYIRIHLQSTVLVSRENISTQEDKLPTPPFVRIHRSFIVNSKWIKSISNDGVELHERELPFGRAFKKSALSMLAIDL